MDNEHDGLPPGHSYVPKSPEAENPNLWGRIKQRLGRRAAAAGLMLTTGVAVGAGVATSIDHLDAKPGIEVQTANRVKSTIKDSLALAFPRPHGDSSVSAEKLIKEYTDKYPTASDIADDGQYSDLPRAGQDYAIAAAVMSFESGDLKDSGIVSDFNAYKLGVTSLISNVDLRNRTTNFSRQQASLNVLLDLSSGQQVSDDSLDAIKQDPDFQAIKQVRDDLSSAKDVKDGVQTRADIKLEIENQARELYETKNENARATRVTTLSTLNLINNQALDIAYPEVFADKDRRTYVAGDVQAVAPADFYFFDGKGAGDAKPPESAETVSPKTTLDRINSGIEAAKAPH